MKREKIFCKEKGADTYRDLCEYLSNNPDLKCETCPELISKQKPQKKTFTKNINKTSKREPSRIKAEKQITEKEMKHDKEKERLQWEFLKRNKDYKEYCEWQRAKTKNSKLALPDKFKPEMGPVQDLNPIGLTFGKYGDIHKSDFESWYFDYYEDDKNGTQIPYKDLHLGAVDDISGVDPSMKYFMRNTFIYIIDKCKRIFGREPSLLEMADFLCAQMRMEREFQSYLKIRQAGFTIKEINRLVDEVRTILKKKIRDKRLRIDELKRYLSIYDIWNESDGKRWVSIAKETIPFYKKKEKESNVDSGDIERMIKRDLSKAKKLIKQAATNFFLED